LFVAGLKLYPEGHKFETDTLHLSIVASYEPTSHTGEDLHIPSEESKVYPDGQLGVAVASHLSVVLFRDPPVRQVEDI
jgi:hypothetical protein